MQTIARRRTRANRQTLRQGRVEFVKQKYADIPQAIRDIFGYFHQTFKLPVMNGPKRWPCRKAVLKFSNDIFKVAATAKLYMPGVRRAFAYHGSLALLCAIDRTVYTMRRRVNLDFGHEKAVLILSNAALHIFRILRTLKGLGSKERHIYQSGYAVANFLFHVPSIDMFNAKLSKFEITTRIEKNTITNHLENIFQELEFAFYGFEENVSGNFAHGLLSATANGDPVIDTVLRRIRSLNDSV